MSARAGEFSRSTCTPGQSLLCLKLLHCSPQTLGNLAPPLPWAPAPPSTLSSHTDLGQLPRAAKPFLTLESPTGLQPRPVQGHTHLWWRKHGSGHACSSLWVRERERGPGSAPEGSTPGRLERRGPEEAGRSLHSKGNSSLDVGQGVWCHNPGDRPLQKCRPQDPGAEGASENIRSHYARHTGTL